MFDKEGCRKDSIGVRGVRVLDLQVTLAAKINEGVPMNVGRPMMKVVTVAMAMWAFAFAGTSYASPVPEIDPGSFGSVLAVVLGSLALLERRKSA